MSVLSEKHKVCSCLQSAEQWDHCSKWSLPQSVKGYKDWHKDYIPGEINLNLKKYNDKHPKELCENTAWNSWRIQACFNLENCVHGGNLSSLAGSCWGSHMEQALDPRLCCPWQGDLTQWSVLTLIWICCFLYICFLYNQLSIFCCIQNSTDKIRITQHVKRRLESEVKNWKGLFLTPTLLTDDAQEQFESRPSSRGPPPHPRGPQWSWKSQVLSPESLRGQSHPKGRVIHNV